MTDDELRLARARRTSPGFAEYLEARAQLRPTRPRASEPTTTRTPHSPDCVRAAGHTGPCLPPMSEPQEAT